MWKTAEMDKKADDTILREGNVQLENHKMTMKNHYEFCRPVKMYGVKTRATGTIFTESIPYIVVLCARLSVLISLLLGAGWSIYGHLLAYYPALCSPLKVVSGLR